MVDFVIIPHAQKEKYQARIADTMIELQSQGLEVVTLTDNQAVVVNGDETRVVVK